MVVRNELRGLVTVAIGGRVLTLVYDWTALAGLREELGKDFDQQLDVAIDTFDLRTLATVLTAGLARHHPEMSAEAIFAASPPLGPTILALRQAMRLAFTGGEEAGADAAENPPMRALIARLIPFWRLSKAPSG